MDNTKVFDGYAKDYTKGRPGYAKALIDCLYSDFGIAESSVIADIGSGTGKFAKHLLDRGSKVYCVEPNDDMRTTAEKELGKYDNFYSVCGDAENTTLGDCFADHITVAQAFHWFDTERFRQECSRIIKKGGKVFLIWNIRDADDPLNRELHDICKKYCPRFRGFSGGIRKDDQRIRDFFGNKYDYVSFEEPLYFDREKFIARTLSSSYSPKDGESGYRQYIDAVVELFGRYSADGIVKMSNSSVAYIGSV